jgi:hypothetical protein
MREPPYADCATIGPAMPLVTDFYVPFRVRLTPWRDLVNARHLQWMTTCGLVTEASIVGYGEYEFIDLIGNAYPHADADDLEVLMNMMGWCAWIDDAFSSGRHSMGLSEITERCDAVKDVVNGSGTGGSRDVLIRSFAAFWPRLVHGMSEYWLARHRWHWSNYLDSHHRWENRIGRLGDGADPETYIARRRWNLGTDFCFDLLERCNHLEVPPQAAEDDRLDRLRVLATKSIWVVNDTISLELEQERGEDVPNLYAMFQADPQRYGDDPAAAAKRFNEEAITEFLEVERDYLSHWWHAGMPPEQMRALESFVEGLWNWISSNLHWHLHTRRYGHEH